MQDTAATSTYNALRVTSACDFFGDEYRAWYVCDRCGKFATPNIEVMEEHKKNDKCDSSWMPYTVGTK